MRPDDFILYSLGATAIGAIVYWAWKDVHKPPEEPTPEMIQQAFYEYLDRMEFERQWLAEDGY